MFIFNLPNDPEITEQSSEIHHQDLDDFLTWEQEDKEDYLN